MNVHIRLLIPPVVGIVDGQEVLHAHGLASTTCGCRIMLGKVVWNDGELSERQRVATCIGCSDHPQVMGRFNDLLTWASFSPSQPYVETCADLFYEALLESA